MGGVNIAARQQAADLIAERLRVAGFAVERMDYDALPGDPYGARSYVIVRDGESRAEGQINARNPGRFAGYGGSGGEALLARVRAVAGGPWAAPMGDAGREQE